MNKTFFGPTRFGVGPRVRRQWSLLLSGAVATACAGDRPNTDHIAATDSTAVGSPAIKWAVPVNITPTNGGAAPVFAVASNGNLALAWVSAPDTGTAGRLYVRANTRQFDSLDTLAGAVSELRDPLGNLSIFGEVPPKIAFARNGTLFAAYLVTKVVAGERWPQNALRFATSVDGGSQWSAPRTVTKDKAFGSYDDHALHVAADGSLYLSWLAVAAKDLSRTFVSRSVDEGSSWSHPATVDMEPSCPCCRTSIASDAAGALYVAWRKRFPGPNGEERDIVVAKSNNHGQSWQRPVRVHTDAWQVDYCPDAGPSLKVASNGDVHIAWWSGKPGSAGTRYAVSHDGGTTFSTPVELGIADHSRASHIQLVVGEGASAGRVLAAWDDGTRAVPQIVLRVSSDGGRSFAPVEVVSADGFHAGYPVVALIGDTVSVAWQQRDVQVARADSIAASKKDHMHASTYINAIGAMQVVMRRGVLPPMRRTANVMRSNARAVAIAQPATIHVPQ